MKKRMLSLVSAVCFLLCASCGTETQQPSSPTESAAPAQTGSGAAAWVSAEEWPVNDYTENIPVPPGEVREMLLDENNGFCAVSLDGVSGEEAELWREELTEAGFRPLAGVEEEVKGTVSSGVVSIGEVYTDGSVFLSVSETDGLMVIDCILAEK